MVLTVSLDIREDVTVLICTAWALTLRMFSIQSQGGAVEPTVSESLSLRSTMALHTELSDMCFCSRRVWGGG